MSLFESLTDGHFWFALTGYGSAILAVESFAARAAAGNDPADHWLGERVVLPLGRALALTLFVLLAYPALFGLADPPGLSEVLGRAGRANRLVSFALLLTLLLPLLPVLRRPAVALPVQGIALSALLFHWLAADLGVEAGLWPGMANALIILAVSVAAPRLAGPPSRLLGEQLDGRLERHGFSALLHDGFLLLLQLPAVVVYTHALGAQL